MGCAAYIVGAVTTYQTWADYPQSPIASSEYPYQIIVEIAGDTYLGIFDQQACLYETEYELYTLRTIGVLGDGTGKRYRLDAGAWTYLNDDTGILSTNGEPESAISFVQAANQDIYFGAELMFAHTTENVAGESNLKRLRNIRVKSGTFIRSRRMKYKSADWERVNI